MRTPPISVMAAFLTRFTGRRADPGRAPGLGLSLGLALAWLGLVVLLPVAALAWRAAGLTWREFAAAALDERALAAYRLTVLAALAAAALNAVFGFVVAWSLARYRFPFKRLVDGLIDLPFALPTAVSGIALTTIYAGTGWLGPALDTLGLKVAFTPLGVIVALTFIGLPFVVRTLQPAIEDLDPGIEEAARLLGATPARTFVSVLLPALRPALLAGFAMAFARALGEYGSVVFISGNLPLKTEIAPLLIMARLEQFDYAGATALSVVLMAGSFLMLLGINALDPRARRAAR
jgi:sulfate/thiosulfate transport system permease protein